MAWVGANYRLLPALTLLSGVYYATLNNGGGHGTLVTLGAKYDLSKRTSLYGTVASVFNRSEEHTSELQSLMRISYAVFCLKKKKNIYHILNSQAIHDHK